MAVEQDYLVRAIKGMAKVIAKVVLKKTEVEYELPESNYSGADYLYKKLMDLLAQGQYNEAENILFDEIGDKDHKKLEVALAFYSKLAEFSNDDLKKGNYSKEEVQDGLRDVAKLYGVVDIMNYFELDDGIEEIR